MPGKTVLMAYFGDIPEELQLRTGMKSRPPVTANLDPGHEAISTQWPPVAPATFTTTKDMSFNDIADALNYSGFGAAIAMANEAASPTDNIKAGTTVKIPPLVYEIPDTAWNGSVPPAEQIIGSLNPSVPAPYIRYKPHNINYYVLYLELCAAAAVTTICPAAFGAAANSIVGGQMMLYAATAALASLSSQTVGLIFHQQNSIDFGRVAEEAALAVISAGVVNGLNAAASSYPAATAMLNTLPGCIIVAEVITLAQQSALVLAHVQKHPDWNAFKTAAFNAVVEAGLGGIGQSPMGKGLISGVETMGDDYIRYGRVDWGDVAAHTLGTMVGSAVGNSVNEHFFPEKPKSLEMDERKDLEFAHAEADPWVQGGMGDHREVYGEHLGEPDRKHHHDNLSEDPAHDIAGGNADIYNNSSNGLSFLESVSISGAKELVGWQTDATPPAEEHSDNTKAVISSGPKFSNATAKISWLLNEDHIVNSFALFAFLKTKKLKDYDATKTILGAVGNCLPSASLKNDLHETFEEIKNNLKFGAALGIGKILLNALPAIKAGKRLKDSYGILKSFFKDSNTTFFGNKLTKGVEAQNLSSGKGGVVLSRFNETARNLSPEGKRNIRILRKWAKSKGYYRKKTNGKPETWYAMVNGVESWMLKIKPEKASRALDSTFPRFDAREFFLKRKQNTFKYLNPFTGERGNRDTLSHIHLETLQPMLVTKHEFSLSP